MWTATTIGWFDAVRDRDVKGGMIIKARCKEDIWNVYRQFAAGYNGKKGKGRRYKMGRPVSNKQWDYRWGIKMPRRTWAQIVYRLAMRIDYSLFKGAVNAQPDQHNKHSAYLTIWSTMLRVQHAEEAEREGITTQPYFNTWASAWDREIDYANDRFDAPPPVATKTIKSVCNEREYRELESQLLSNNNERKQ